MTVSYQISDIGSAIVRARVPNRASVVIKADDIRSDLRDMCAAIAHATTGVENLLPPAKLTRVNVADKVLIE